MTEIREKNAIDLAHWVGTVHQTRTNAVGRFGRGVQDAPVNIVVPAVVAAGDAVFLDDAVFQTGTSVRAVFVHQAQPPRTITKNHQVFAKDTQRHRQITHLIGHGDRLPAPAQPFPTGAAWANAGQLGIRVPDIAPQVTRVPFEP